MVFDTAIANERPAEGVPVQNLLSGLNCSGSEEKLADCDHDEVNVVPSGCSRAYVECIMEGRYQNRSVYCYVLMARETEMSYMWVNQPACFTLGDFSIIETLPACVVE